MPLALRNCIANGSPQNLQLFFSITYHDTHSPLLQFMGLLKENNICKPFPKLLDSDMPLQICVSFVSTPTDDR